MQRLLALRIASTSPHEVTAWCLLSRATTRLAHSHARRTGFWHMKTAKVQLSPAHRCFGKPSAGLQLQLLSKLLHAPTQQRQKSLILIGVPRKTRKLTSAHAKHPDKGYPGSQGVSSERQVIAGNGSAQTDQLKTGPACFSNRSLLSSALGGAKWLQLRGMTRHEQLDSCRCEQGAGGG